MFGRPTFRGKVQLIVFLFLPIYLLNFSGELVHSFLSPHTICPEHLEIVDAPTAPSTNHDHTQVVVTAADDGKSGETHEHCGFFHARRKNSVLTPVSCYVGHADSGFELALPLISVASFATEPRYRLAPKNSPPA